MLLVKLINNACKEVRFSKFAAIQPVALLFPLAADFFQIFSWLLRENDIWEAIQTQPSIGVLINGVLKTCSKFTGEQTYRSVISINLLCNFIEITLRHGCSPVNLLYIFRTPFRKSTCGGLLLAMQSAFTNSYLIRNARTRSETGFKQTKK